MATRQDSGLADHLLAQAFHRTGPATSELTDPIADTPMVVTLDQLRPYDLNPRVTVNPLYAEIKASIRERGLDAAPAITRRPGEAHYTIRNGGNTRLAILRELWAETKDERFFRIPCLFRPWPARGEIVALTGHLAENELHGSLTFIERALGVEKARELYEQENGGKPMTQAELARRLAADGYPVPQPHISRMRDAVQYLLPAIPSLLYAGLGRHQVERLSLLRKAGEHAWAQRAIAQAPTMEFANLFQEVLSGFDALPDGFSYERVQDELIGQMAQWLEADYDTLALDIAGVESRQRALLSVPAPSPSPGGVAAPASQAAASTRPEIRSETPPATPRAPSDPTPRAAGARDADHAALVSPRDTPDPMEARVQDHVVSPAASTERLQSLQKLVADHHGEASPSFADNVVQAIPVQAGGLYPISDVWHIDPGLDTPDRLRVHIAQFAREIAAEGSAADRIAATDHGLGFACDEDPAAVAPLAHAMLALLRALEAGYAGPAALAAPCTLAEALTPLLRPHGTAPRLSDSGLVKLFRLLRLARRLAEVEAGADAMPT
ncbi:integrating conjugative element, PFGI_1 class, ParB family protein [Paracidovorax valerianellae]|uniref:Integrating conjugative element, PFGI_1 class, ParB family protein n=1 Tax=Paracidovorax valerianellae TaxID=187868 RepID=A0A1G6L9R7_9BURK|nr:ParB family protein [Paracidovorax valerianellae]SDC40069.1 integrating conjugative element, PFGI_1 class, ParB family protein [Paracidovorax valerianellae]